MEIEPWSPWSPREREKRFLKFEEAAGCRGKSKEMGESGVTRIYDVAL